VYAFIDKHIDRSLPKEHMGYIVDRTGFDTFCEEVTNSIDLNSEAEIVKVENPGYFYNIRD